MVRRYSASRSLPTLTMPLNPRRKFSSRAATEAQRTVTVSIGFTRIAGAPMPASLLIERADQAMYYAKAHGRNRVASWEELLAEGKVSPSPARAVDFDVTLF